MKTATKTNRVILFLFRAVAILLLLLWLPANGYSAESHHAIQPNSIVSMRLHLHYIYDNIAPSDLEMAGAESVYTRMGTGLGMMFLPDETFNLGWSAESGSINSKVKYPETPTSNYELDSHYFIHGPSVTVLFAWEENWNILLGFHYLEGMVESTKQNIALSAATKSTLQEKRVELAFTHHSGTFISLTYDEFTPLHHQRHKLAMNFGIYFF